MASECCLLLVSGGDCGPFCLQFLLPGLLLVLIVIILILVFWILPKYKASKFLRSFAIVFPWWLRQLRICLQCRRPGFNPWVGKIP